MASERDGITDDPDDRPGGFREGPLPSPPEDDEDRPSQRRFEDANPYRFRRRTGLEALFGNSGWPIVVLFSLLCGGWGLVLGIAGVIFCHDQEARTKAFVTALISSVSIWAWILLA